MKKLLAILLTTILVLGILAGCGSTQQTSDQKTTAEPTASAAPADSTQTQTEVSQYPLTVKDANGVEVKLEKEPKSIVSLTLGSDEMLIGLLKDKSRIKSLTKYADDPGISNIVADAKAVPNRAESVAESVIALAPDLVLADTWATADFIKQLRDAKITVYQFKTPSNIEEQKKTIQELAHVVGEDAQGTELVKWMDTELNKIEENLKALKPEQKLTVLDYSEGGTTSGKGTNFDDIVTRAGLVNASAKAGMEGWPEISKEKIVEFNPDIMILPSWFYDKSKNTDSFTNAIKGDKSLQNVKAVKNGKLFMVPNAHLTAISQYVVLGVEDVARVAYPDLFKSPKVCNLLPPKSSGSSCTTADSSTK